MPMFRFIYLGLLSLALFFSPSKAGCEEYPSRPLTVIIPSTKGGGADVSFRQLARALEPILGQKIEIVNMPADSGAEGLAALAAAPPDGYTLGAVWNGPLTASPQIRQLPYSLDSFTIVVSTYESDYFVCARKDLPAATGPELIALLRQQPFGYTYGNEGKGGGGYFAGERLFDSLRLFLRSQSFNGSSDAAKNFSEGKIDLYVGTIPAIRPHLQTGVAKCLVVMGTAKPSFLPDVSTVAEIGAPGTEASPWRMIIAPKGLAADKTAKLETAVRHALAAPVMSDFYAGQGERPLGQGGAETLARLKAEYAAFSDIAERLGLKAE